MHIQVLALQGVFDTGLSLMLDAFATANQLASMQGFDAVHFDVAVVGLQRKISTGHGLQVSTRALSAQRAPDWLLIPAIDCKLPEVLAPALQRRDVQDAGDALCQLAAGGVRIGAACIGTFVLAECGLLNGQQATTTWWLAPMFRRRYPEVKLDEAKMLVSSERFLTSGAALSHIDLALWVIRQESPAIASLTANYLIVDSRPSQSAFAVPDQLAHSDPMVTGFERWARGRLAEGFSLDEAAAALATSKRTLARRLQDTLGKSPLAYFQDLRVERAVHLLRTSNDSIERIASQVGYADGVTLRTLLRSKLGRGIREIRAR